MTSYEQILKNLRNKVYHPIYLLMGDEPYFIDCISSYIEKNVLDETEKEFNLTILYGQDCDVQIIMNNAKRYPMMSNYHVVIVKEAQNLKDFEEFLPYAGHPLKSTILVLCCKFKTVDKRKKLFKEIEKSGVTFESETLYESQLPRWITTFLKERDYAIQPQAALLLTDHLGNDLSRVANELEKLCLNIPAKTIIDGGHIEKFIGISKDYNNFELLAALATRNILKANRIINYFDSNPKSNPLPLTLGALFSFFSKVFVYHYLNDKSKNNVAAVLKINPYFVREYEQAAKNYGKEKLKKAISAIRDCDAKQKGINNASLPGGELLRELIYGVLH